MHILIVGGGGVVGQKLAHSLVKRGKLRGQEISKITLADIVDPPKVIAPFDVACISCYISNPTSVADSLGADVDVIYLLAAIVSAHAEEGERITISGEFIDTWCYFSGVMGGTDGVVGSAHHVWHSIAKGRFSCAQAALYCSWGYSRIWHHYVHAMSNPH